MSLQLDAQKKFSFFRREQLVILNLWRLAINLGLGQPTDVRYCVLGAIYACTKDDDRK